jgi:uridine kinase
MFIYNNIFENDEQIRLFVEDSERNYKNQVLKIATEISELDHIKFLTLSGPTCSGKTTTSYILEHEFEKRGSTVKIISIDDFYRNRNDISDDEKPDYESISAIDFPIFQSCVDKILKGETAMIPIYDFKDGVRKGFVPYTPVEHEIIIFEGIQAIYPEILSTLPKDISKSIYISVSDDVNANGTIFDKRDVRFFRRLLRDFLFRSATPERTLELWEGVVENEDKNIIPNEKNADYTINSFLPYELGVIKPYLLHVVSYDFSKSHEKELYDLIQMKFKNIEEIPSRFVPTDSVFREFIGKES